MPSKCSAEVQAKAVRLVGDRVQGYGSEWAAITTIASWMGMTPETLGELVRQDEIDRGDRAGRTSEEIAEVRRLKRENSELKRTNEILQAASVVFARELDQKQP